MTEYDDLSASIDAIRHNRDRDTDNRRSKIEILREVAATILKDLNSRGAFYNDGQRPYYFFNDSKRLVDIRFDSDPFMLIVGKYGINRSEQIFKYIYEELYREAFENGTKTEIHRMAFYDQDRHILYLFNRRNQIYRITTQKVDLVDNGTDGVLFISARETELFTASLREQAVSPLDELLFSKLNFTSDILSPPERTILFIIFFYAPFFASIMPTKPILTMVGEKGSGKTTTLRLAGMVYMGEKFDVTSLSNDPKDFDAAVTNTPFVVFDNADQTKKWLDDKLAVASHRWERAEARALHHEQARRFSNSGLYCFDLSDAFFSQR